MNTQAATRRGKQSGEDIAALRARLAEAEDMLRAIKRGEVDAIVRSGPGGEQVFTLKGAEHAYRQMVEAMSEGAITISTDGIVLYANRRFAELMEADLEWVIGARVQDFVLPAQLVRFKSLMQAAGNEAARDQVDLMRPDGEVVPTQMAMQSLGAEGDHGIVAVVTDLTEIKRMETQLRTHQERLEREVQARTASLQVANDSLEAANKDLESFSYSVSHDLRAPLRAIDSFSQILLEEYSPVLDAEGQRVLRTVRRNTGKMEELIEDILAFSRAGRRELVLTDVDVASLCREIVGELLSSIPGRRIDVRIGELPSAHADAAMLRQVLVNLLSNAIKFTGTREQAEIDITGSASADQVTYSIRDNGVGFNPDYAHKLFGVFQRLHSDSEFPGTGIGLAIVKRVIDKLDGRVWAEGQLDRGATFHISLPGSPDATRSGAPT
ncbi:MAG: ATP-binding protein [Pseudomonadota bacterium]